MKKDKKFLTELENNLTDIKDDIKKEIISKYENIIKEEKAQNKKITAILKEIGKPEDVAKKEIELLGGKGGKNFFDRWKDKRKEKSEKRLIEKEKKQKAKEENNASKNMKDKTVKVSVLNNVSDKEKEKAKKEKLKEKEKKKKEKLKRKEEKKKLKEEKRKEKELLKLKKKEEKEKKKDLKEKPKKEEKKKDKKENKEKLSFKERLHKFKSAITKDISFKKKERKVTDSPKEIVEEVKEEVEEEIADVSEIVTETKVFETKGQRRKRIIFGIIGVLLTIILLFAWLWVCVVLIASVVAYLDGVKFKGLIIGLFGLSMLMLWIVVMVNRGIFRKKMSVRLNLIIIIVSIILIALGIVLTVKQISEIKTVKDVSVKYSTTTKMNYYDFPDDKNKKFTLTFNSNYNTQYTINYDNTLKDRFKVEVKYYECYYDYYQKQVSNGAYVSLKLDDRDRLAVYIDDLKEGLVFDNDELARYSVKITINQKDVERLTILD